MAQKSRKKQSHIAADLISAPHAMWLPEKKWAARICMQLQLNSQTLSQLAEILAVNKCQLGWASKKTLLTYVNRFTTRYSQRNLWLQPSLRLLSSLTYPCLAVQSHSSGKAYAASEDKLQHILIFFSSAHPKQIIMFPRSVAAVSPLPSFPSQKPTEKDRAKKK